jgi:hypothetical protein
VTVFSVSNRQKATVIGCGSEAEGTFVFRLALALAHHGNTLPAFISQLESDLEALDRRQPPDPARLLPPPAATPPDGRQIPESPGRDDTST